MAEASEYIKKNKDAEKDLKAFVKSFITLKPAEAKELRKNISNLNIIKINEKNISKIIDIMPESSQELNKVLPDVSLSEDELKKVLDEIKKFK
jgi:DNA-directed RNA polymerase subunit F